MPHRTSISMYDETRKEIDKRGDLSSIIRRDLGRLYAMYEVELSQIDLTVDEACAIVDALNGTISDVRSARMLWAQVEDAEKYEGLGEKWDVDVAQLSTKLRAMEMIRCLAIIDAAEQFWHDERYREMDIRKAVKEIFKID